ncbi:MAG TPA: 16S rRNA (guanine(527)-N(7))-methyltransferase RsmG [Bacteroidia bacterium]|nr:16S rRNA (guanine(527)-N(7))-methyltransferase RsmG [Bacteroidia bacterium]
MPVDIIFKYFPSLADDARIKFNRLGELYSDWNAKVNLISRTDIEFLYERHVLHSLAIAKFINFKDGTRVMDIGTGGGFPGIPLAIMFPKVQFTLVDSIGKKIKVVEDVIAQLELKNAVAICERAEKVEGKFDYVVSRATAPLGDLYKWSRIKIDPVQKNAIPNGIICLKGGDLTEEIKPFRGRTEMVSISDFFDEDFFLTKKLLFLTI